MINVIIAEDQQLILKDLCNKISKLDNDINIVSTARNGEEAYEKILLHKPDIVFTDIGMPLLSGLEMIQKLKAENLNTRFVIISGYKDFEYAREAIKMGVDEYLLKPIVIEDIKKILDSLKSKLTMKKQDYLQHAINKLINSTVNESKSINIDFNYSNYYVALFVAGPYSNFTIDCATPFYDTWNEVDILKISQKYITDDNKFFLTSGQNRNEIVGILATNNNIDYNYATFKNLCNEVSSICNYKNIPITVGVSRPLKHISNIGVTSQIVRTIIKKKIVYCKTNILDCSKDKIHLHKFRTFISDDIEKKFRFIIKNNHKDSFTKECFSLLQYLENNDATQMEVEKCFKTIIDLFNINSINNNYVSDIYLELDECICSSKNYIEFASRLNILFSKLIDEHNKSTESNNSMNNIIEASKEYIKNHFSEDINVNDIANLFSISPTYFSKLFKKEVGIPPVVYINKYRIEKACYYFNNTDFTVKEVAELCGYSDPFYFSKAFKSIVGIPPKEYKLKK